MTPRMVMIMVSPLRGYLRLRPAGPKCDPDTTKSVNRLPQF
jgi:hypothetical protein